MDRKEAVVLLKELGNECLVQPSFVIIEQRRPGFQLKIKDDYDRRLIEAFLISRGFSYEENRDFLIIFKA